MADIIKLDSATATTYLEGRNAVPFQTVAATFLNTATVQLSGGTAEIFGSVIYIVDSGNVNIASTVSAGGVYLELSEDGDGTATATWTANAGTFNPALNGYYNGSNKVIGFAFPITTGSSTYAFFHYNPAQNLSLSRLHVENNANFGNDVVIDNDLDVGNDITATGNITAGSAIASATEVVAENYMYSTRGRQCNLGFFSALSTTSGALYTQLNPYVPTTLDLKIIASGFIVNPSASPVVYYPVTYVERTVATSISINTPAGPIVATSGSSSTFIFTGIVSL